MPTNAPVLTQVMLVEDNPGDAILIQEMLSEVEAGAFNCKFADRLSAAIDQLSIEPVDVLLLDLSLPDSTGLDALVKLIAQEPHLPIVVLTGLEDEAVAVKAIQEGAQDYLVKGQVTSRLLVRSLRYAIERKRSAEQLAQMAAELGQNNRELHLLNNKVSALEQLKTDMIRLASHDLLGLVNIINGYLYLLRTEIWDTLSGEQRDSFQLLAATTERMRRLTQDILSLDRIESAATNQQHTLDLGALVERVFQQNLAQAAQKAQQYTLVMSPTPLAVKGDSAQLQEAITNLINNAIKYTPDHGSIEVRLNPNTNNVKFEVQDSGYGIPLAMQDQLFQAFFRAKTEQTNHIDGTGLGLHLVKRVIERHDGHVYFSSVQGQGSLFGFELPLDFPADATAPGNER